jgi:hypothetical protein
MPGQAPACDTTPNSFRDVSAQATDESMFAREMRVRTTSRMMKDYVSWRLKGC